MRTGNWWPDSENKVYGQLDEDNQNLGFVFAFTQILLKQQVKS